MSKRLRDICRKYLSGSKKRALAKAKKAEEEKEKGSLDRFLCKNVPDKSDETDVQSSVTLKKFYQSSKTVRALMVIQTLPMILQPGQK